MPTNSAAVLPSVSLTRSPSSTSRIWRFSSAVGFAQLTPAASPAAALPLVSLANALSSLLRAWPLSAAAWARQVTQLAGLPVVEVSALQGGNAGSAS